VCALKRHVAPNVHAEIAQRADGHRNVPLSGRSPDDSHAAV
jgi:hypothetical protein